MESSTFAVTVAFIPDHRGRSSDIVFFRKKVTDEAP